MIVVVAVVVVLLGSYGISIVPSPVAQLLKPQVCKLRLVVATRMA